MELGRVVPITPRSRDLNPYHSLVLPRYSITGFEVDTSGALVSTVLVVVVVIVIVVIIKPVVIGNGTARRLRAIVVMVVAFGYDLSIGGHGDDNLDYFIDVTDFFLNVVCQLFISLFWGEREGG